MSERPRRHGRLPDIDISTSVTAKELKFERVPESGMRFTCDPSHDHESYSEVELENLPEEPEEGVVYRDVKVDWSVVQWIVHPTDEAEEAAVTGDEAEAG